MAFTMESKQFNQNLFSFSFLEILSNFKLGGKDYPLINFSILAFWFIAINYFLYDNLTDAEFWENFHRTTDSLILTWGTRVQNIASLILGIVIVIMSFAHVAIKKEHFHAMFETIVYVDKIFEKEFHYDMQFTFLTK